MGQKNWYMHDPTLRDSWSLTFPVVRNRTEIDGALARDTVTAGAGPESPACLMTCSAPSKHSPHIGLSSCLPPAKQTHLRHRKDDSAPFQAYSTMLTAWAATTTCVQGDLWGHFGDRRNCNGLAPPRRGVGEVPGHAGDEAQDAN